MDVKDTGVSPKSDRLEGKRIAVAVCGGIAAVEVVKIIRELRRHGAKITPFMTPSSSRFIGPDALSWAAETGVIAESSAQVEYLKEYDLVLVCPATLNTIAKAALALTDNVVSLLIASQIGAKRKVLMVPAMNLAMLEHPAYGEYRARLEAWGVNFLQLPCEEGRLKIPSFEAVANRVLEIL